MIQVLMPPTAVAAPYASRRRFGPRTVRSYGCPLQLVDQRIAAWYTANDILPEVLWARRPQIEGSPTRSRLSRAPKIVASREKLIRELSLDPAPALRISPGDIARHAGIPHPITFTIAARLRQRSPTS